MILELLSSVSVSKENYELIKSQQNEIRAIPSQELGIRVVKMSVVSLTLWHPKPYACPMFFVLLASPSCWVFTVYDNYQKYFQGIVHKLTFSGGPEVRKLENRTKLGSFSFSWKWRIPFIEDKTEYKQPEFGSQSPSLLLYSPRAVQYNELCWRSLKPPPMRKFL